MAQFKLVVDWSTGGDVTKHRSNNTVGAYEAKTHMSELLEKVEAGEEITITRHGTPIAKLVPVKKETSQEERLAAIERIQHLASGLSLAGLKVKDLLELGRRLAQRLLLIARSPWPGCSTTRRRRKP